MDDESWGSLIVVIVAIILLHTPNTAASTVCDGVNLQAHGMSKHFSAHRKFREKNYGAGLSCENIGSDWSAGVYKNSVYRDSAYISNTRYARFGELWHLDLGYTYGLVTGYPAEEKLPQVDGVAMLGYLTAAVGHARYGKINLMLVPGVVVAASIEIKLF